MPAGRSWTSRSCCISAPLLGQIHPTMPRSSTVLLPVEIFCLAQATPVELAGGIHNGFRKKEHHGLLLEMWMEEHVQITEQLWTDLNKTWTQLGFKAFDSWHLVARSLTRFKVGEALDLCICCCNRHFTFAQGLAQSIPEAIPSYNTCYEKRWICMLKGTGSDEWFCPLPTDGALIMHWLCTDYSCHCNLRLQWVKEKTDSDR